MDLNVTYTAPRQLVSCFGNGTKTVCFPLPASTGKERDEETGYGYFGARYMDHELMTMWLSVDPMADKYPSISPYAYCAWNPVRLVDPDGEEAIDDWYKDAQGYVYWDDNVHSQADLNSGDSYIGRTALMVAEGSGETTYGDQYGNTHSFIPLASVTVSTTSKDVQNVINRVSCPTWVPEATLGVSLGTSMFEGACNSSYPNSVPLNESRIANGFNIGGKAMSIIGKVAGGLGVIYTGYRAYSNDGKVSTGEWLHIGLQVSVLGSSFIPKCGAFISTGLTVVDVIWGDDIEEIGNK